MAKTQKLTEEERRALVERWANTPSPNPRYRGLTPQEVARAMKPQEKEE